MKKRRRVDWKSYLLSFPSPLDLALIVRGECKYGSVWGKWGTRQRRSVQQTSKKVVRSVKQTALRGSDSGRAEQSPEKGQEHKKAFVISALLPRPPAHFFESSARPKEERLFSPSAVAQLEKSSFQSFYPVFFGQPLIFQKFYRDLSSRKVHIAACKYTVAHQEPLRTQKEAVSQCRIQKRKKEKYYYCYYNYYYHKNKSGKKRERESGFFLLFAGTTESRHLSHPPSPPSHGRG